MGQKNKLICGCSSNCLLEKLSLSQVMRSTPVPKKDSRKKGVPPRGVPGHTYNLRRSSDLTRGPSPATQKILGVTPASSVTTSAQGSQAPPNSQWPAVAPWEMKRMPVPGLSGKEEKDGFPTDNFDPFDDDLEGLMADIEQSLTPGLKSPSVKGGAPDSGTAQGPSFSPAVKFDTQSLDGFGESDGMFGGGENYLGTQEDLEGQDPEKQGFIEMLAHATAKKLAGVPVPQTNNTKPMNQAVSGYTGGSNVEGKDILNSSATGTATGPQGQPLSTQQRGVGDTFVAAKETRNSTTDTLRPTFGIAPANAVIPTKKQQINSDVLFSDFSIVAPGNGLGVTNKMFLMEEMRDKNFVFKEPLAEPRKYDGPTNGVEVMPLQWQNQISKADRRLLNEQEIAEEATGVLLEKRAGYGSLNVTGDDFGMFQDTSDKGLKRHRESPLEPILLTPKGWERVKGLPGVQWSRKQFRRLFDAQRYPERFASNLAMSGGSTCDRQSALALYPFPLTT